jgi:type II secretory pathway pseudopilin PulG
MKFLSNKKGFSLIEIVVYIGIFSVVSTAIIVSSMVVISSFNKTKVSRNVLESSSTIMERMTREIRSAQSVNTLTSSLSVNPGVLDLVGFDDLSNARNVRFSVDPSGHLNISENGELIGSLVNDGVVVSSLIFRRIQNASSEAVKIEMTLTGSNGSWSTSKNFYNTVLLRGGY